jgi:hypothetical protein
MVAFPIRIELPNVMAAQGPHDANAREHRSFGFGCAHRVLNLADRQRLDRRSGWPAGAGSSYLTGSAAANCRVTFLGRFIPDNFQPVPSKWMLTAE